MPQQTQKDFLPGLPGPSDGVLTVREGVDVFLATMDDLEGENVIRAAVLRALASRLDAAASSESGAMAVAAAGIAKELRMTLTDLVGDSDGEADDFVARLFEDVDLNVDLNGGLGHVS
jgi:hypothetical protein